MEDFITEVTEDHIRRGKPKSYTACPVSLALNESRQFIPEQKKISITHHTCKAVSRSGKSVHLGLVSKELSQWLDDFDKGREVRPFTLALRSGTFRREA